MIAVKTLATLMENTLNAAAKDTGIVYKIHSDMGSYKRSLKSRTAKQRYTNGLLTIVDSAVVPTQTITVASQSAVLEICVALPIPKQDEATIAAHRAVLDGVLSKSPLVDIIDGYSVTAVYTMAESGTVEQRDGIGTSFTFTIGIDYSFIEGGLSSYDCVFLLDNVQIPYTSFHMTRTPSIEANPYSTTDGLSGAVDTAEVLGFDFQVPAQTLENGISEVLLDQLLDGDGNGIHVLTVQLGTRTRTYNVLFGQTDIVIEGVANAGHNISLVVAAPVVGG